MSVYQGILVASFIFTSVLFWQVLTRQIALSKKSLAEMRKSDHMPGSREQQEAQEEKALRIVQRGILEGLFGLMLFCLLVVLAWVLFESAR